MCSSQPLSVPITMILNKLKPKIYQFWNTALKNVNTSALRIWMLKNSTEIPYRIKLFNRTYNLQPQRQILLETYDKTLYTNIPHDDLLIKIWELFESISGLNKHNTMMLASNRKGYKICTWWISIWQSMNWTLWFNYYINKDGTCSLISVPQCAMWTISSL